MPDVLPKNSCSDAKSGLISSIERDLTVEEWTSDVLPLTTNELQSDGIPRFRSRRRVCDSEEDVRAVVEVEGLVEVAKDLGEDLVREDVEV